ncbi:hypothetical protein R9X47_18125 [Wukongibacter baidiensis]|uniref:XkdQ/YqbQ family protein n=1 Tax=Wukongibacter baidiensis TaxID=1723361 RepID=UPI003D7FFB47
MHQLYNVSNNTQTNITPLVGNLQWRSNINELGEQLDFEVAFNDDRYFPVNPVDLGSMIRLENEDEIFRGIVVSEQRNGRNAINYTCFDYAFYLNKSKEIYQFNKIPGQKAIETILNDFKVPIGSIAPITTLINKIYYDKPLSDIIKEIIDIAEKEKGVKYRMEMRQGKLYIEKQEDLVIKASFKLAENIQPYDITSAISSPSRKRTIEDMKNSIKIVFDDKVLAEKKDDNLISKYGVLQEIRAIDENDTAKARNVAQNMLKELGKIFEENSVEMIGNDKVRAGRIIEIEEPVTGMSGQYLIKDVTHTIKNGIHRMQVGLGVK